MFKRIALIALCLTLAACARPRCRRAARRRRARPDRHLRRGPIQDRRPQAARLGADSTAPASETRRVVYYDVELRLDRDITLGAWDKPGAASLVTLLGAGPRSISGVKSSGNQAGDRIVAHASAIYRKDGDAWTLVTPAGFKAAEAPTLDSGTPPTVTRQLLDTLDQITHSVAYSASSTAQHVVQQELERSVSRINGRLSRLQHGYPLAGGPDRGEYVAFARALAGASRSQQIRITPLITGGGAENIALLRAGDVTVALAQADTARLAYEGKGPFADQARSPRARWAACIRNWCISWCAGTPGCATCATSKASASRSVRKARPCARRWNALAAHGMQAGRDYMVIDTPFSASRAGAECRRPRRRSPGDRRAGHAARRPGPGQAPAATARSRRHQALSAGEDGVLMPIDIAAGTYPDQPTRWRQSARPPCCRPRPN